MQYHKKEIPKGNGKTRTLYIVSKADRAKLKEHVPMTEEAARHACPPRVVHGFWPNRSCVTNAQAHVGYHYSVCMDLMDFFDHCTQEKMSAAWRPPSVAIPAFLEGAARQGLPTSPAVSNICAAEMDWVIVELCKRWGDVVYTRYADDLTFSCNSPQRVKDILKEIPKIVAEHDFQVNESKTKVQCAKAGRRIITGVAVDDQGVRPTRRAKRKARAAAYKAARRKNPHYRHRAAGLAEWCKCKPPRLGKKARKKMEIASPEEGIRIAARAAQFA